MPKDMTCSKVVLLAALKPHLQPPIVRKRHHVHAGVVVYRKEHRAADALLAATAKYAYHGLPGPRTAYAVCIADIPCYERQASTLLRASSLWERAWRL